MRKIHLRLYDQADYLKRVNKSKRFEILVSIGSKTYHFSNRQKCERFLSQLNNYITDCYKFFLQVYADLNTSFSALFPYCPNYQTYKIKDTFRMVLDTFDMAFSDSHIRDNSVLINWVFWLESNLLKVCKILKKIARKSRNQCEFARLQMIQNTIFLHTDNFYKRYKNFEYTGQVNSSECEVLNLYNPLQLVINF